MVPLAVLLASIALSSPPTRLAPLACAAGTTRKGAAPPDDFEEWCEGKDPYGNGRREGPARRWYDDGALWILQSFREGILDGPFRELHRNGRTAREGTYAMGRQVGTWRIWFESGGPEEECEFADGVRHGRFVAYWPTGAIRTEGRHCGGSQCGRWKTFDGQGKPVGEVDYGEQTLKP
jgi:antitoxin component YwqK of YwqJK toxin-antitoxin module